jgi:excisionase family DNA binding protein
MDGKQKIKAALADLDSAIDSNDCGMGSSTFVVLAVFIREIVKFVRRKRYLSTDEAARMIGVSPRTLRRRVEEGLIPPPKHYGHHEVSYRYEDIEEYLLCNNGSKS